MNYAILILADHLEKQEMEVYFEKESSWLTRYIWPYSSREQPSGTSGAQINKAQAEALVSPRETLHLPERVRITIWEKDSLSDMIHFTYVEPW